jgi:hypothetical protein
MHLAQDNDVTHAGLIRRARPSSHAFVQARANFQSVLRAEHSGDGSLRPDAMLRVSLLWHGAIDRRVVYNARLLRSRRRSQPGDGFRFWVKGLAPHRNTVASRKSPVAALPVRLNATAHVWPNTFQ